MSRTLIVTGASSGIGEAVARQARRLGWRVFAGVRRPADRAALEREGCATGLLELTGEDSLDAFADSAAEWCGGRLDALVNNAGAAFPGPIEEQPAHEIRAQFEVNVFGHIALTRRLLPLLRPARGRIVFVSSDRARAAVPGYGAYVASKRALEGFAEVLAAELQPSGVGVSILELGSFISAIRGPIAARLAECARRTVHYAELIDTLSAQLGGPPLLPPEAAAEAVLELLRTPDPPMLAAYPPQSLAKLLRQQLRELEGGIEQLIGTNVPR